MNSHLGVASGDPDHDGTRRSYHENMPPRRTTSARATFVVEDRVPGVRQTYDRPLAAAGS